VKEGERKLRLGEITKRDRKKGGSQKSRLEEHGRNKCIRNKYIDRRQGWSRRRGGTKVKRKCAAYILEN
jgi:hypothetical protein